MGIIIAIFLSFQLSFDDEDTYVQTVAANFAPAEVKGLYRKYPYTPPQFTPDGLSPVTKIRQLLDHMINSTENPEVRKGFTMVTDEPGKYYIVQTGPFDYWGEAYLTAKESRHYDKWVGQHLIPIPIYESQTKYLLEYKGEVFKLLLYEFDDRDPSYIDDVVFGSSTSAKMPTLVCEPPDLVPILNPDNLTLMCAELATAEKLIPDGWIRVDGND